MDMTFLLQIGLVFTLGYLGALMASKVKLPRVSAYVLVGIALSPTVTGVISHEFLQESKVFIDLALAMVAYTLGGHLRITGLRKTGREICAITLGQGLGAYIFVTMSSFIFILYVYPAFTMIDVIIISLLFGAISLSTAPAATIATIHECKARGTFTSVLLAVVALDDALGLVFFAITLTVIKGFVAGASQTNLTIVSALLRILYSIAIGGGLGFLLVWTLQYINRKDSLIVLTVAAFCMSFGLAETLHLEPLFATMIMGMTVANFYPDDLPFRFLEGYYEPVVFIVFFVLAGAHIDLAVMIDYLPLAVLFVVFRVSGKWIGTYLAGTLVGAPVSHSRYLGLALSPQAGIAIGLALYVQRIPALEVYGTIAINVIIAKTAINEILGPYLLKRALIKVQECKI